MCGTSTIKWCSYLYFLVCLFCLVCLLSRNGMGQLGPNKISFAENGNVLYDTACKCANNTVKIYGSVMNGFSYKWQSHSSSNSVWGDVGCVTQNYELSVSNLTDTAMFYRRIADSINKSIFSNVVKLKVFYYPDAGTITCDTIFCQGDSVLATLINFTGTIKRWYQKNLSGNWDSIPNSDTNMIFLRPLSPGNFYYKAEVINGSCFRYTNPLKLTVKPKPSVTATPGSSTVCAHSPVSIQLSSTPQGNPVSYSWTRDQQSAIKGFSNGGTNNPITGTPVYNNSQQITPMTITFRCSVTLDGCQSDTISALLTVKNVPECSFSTSTASVCDKENITINLQSTFPNSGFTTTLLTPASQISFTNTSANPAIITGKPVLKTASETNLQFSCTAGYNGCTSDAINPSVKVKPFPKSGNIIGESDSICLSHPVPYDLDTFENDYLVKWNLSGTPKGMIQNDSNPLAKITWSAQGIDTIRATVSRQGCATRLTQPVTISYKKYPADRLVRMGDIADTLILLCQEHINEKSLDYHYTWGYYITGTPGEKIVLAKSRQSYCMFTGEDFDTVNYHYFVEISYTDGASCVVRTDYLGDKKKADFTRQHLSNVFPNPNKGNFTLSVGNTANGRFSISLTDASGVVHSEQWFVKVQPEQNFPVHSGNLRPALYMVVLRFDSGEVMVNKMVVY